MNPYNQSLEGLFKVYGDWNPLAYMKGMDMVDQAGQYNDMQKQLLGQQLEREKQMLPVDVAHKQLTNQGLELGLPGIFADSNLKQDKAVLSRATLDQQHEQFIRDFQAKGSQQEAEQFQRVGQLYAQAGEMLKGIPGMMSHQRAKEILGKNYLPEFDQVPPHLLGAAVGSIGKDMMGVAPKLWGQQQLQDDKQSFLQAQLEKKLAAEKELAAYKASLQEKLAKLKASGNPKTYEAVIVELKKQADQEPDPTRRALILDQVQEFVNLQFAMKQAGAQAGATGKVDVPGVAGLPAIPPAQPPQVRPPQPKPGSSPDNPIVLK